MVEELKIMIDSMNTMIKNIYDDKHKKKYYKTKSKGGVSSSKIIISG